MRQRTRCAARTPPSFTQTAHQGSPEDLSRQISSHGRKQSWGHRGGQAVQRMASALDRTGKWLESQCGACTMGAMCSMALHRQVAATSSCSFPTLPRVGPHTECCDQSCNQGEAQGGRMTVNQSIYLSIEPSIDTSINQHKSFGST